MATTDNISNLNFCWFLFLDKLKLNTEYISLITKYVVNNYSLYFGFSLKVINEVFLVYIYKKIRVIISNFTYKLFLDILNFGILFNQVSFCFSSNLIVCKLNYIFIFHSFVLKHLNKL